MQLTEHITKDLTEKKEAAKTVSCHLKKNTVFMAKCPPPQQKAPFSDFTQNEMSPMEVTLEVIQNGKRIWMNLIDLGAIQYLLWIHLKMRN